MQRSRAEIYWHFVWATKQRMALIQPEIERALYRCIALEAERLGCVVMAIGGMPDHVHLLVKAPTTISASKIMQQVKGVSSHFVHERLGMDAAFNWQENYGVFSVTPSHVRRVVGYVQHQKDHHASGEVWGGWEEVAEVLDDRVVNDPA